MARAFFSPRPPSRPGPGPGRNHHTRAGVASLPALPVSALERWFAAHEFSAPHLACCSDVHPLTLTELTGLMDDASVTAFRSVSLGYVDASGTPELRGEVAARAGGG